MARLPLSVWLRRAFEREDSKVQLDETLARFFAAMLEDDEDYDEDNIVEVWSSYLVALLEKEGTCKELCLSVLKRLKGCETLALGDICSAANSPQLSRAGSLNQTAPSPAVVDVSTTPSEPCDPTEEVQEVEGLDEWLETLSLSHYAAAAREWCSELGAATVEEIEENWEEFSEALKLKHLERRRLELRAGPLSEEATPQARHNADEEEEAESSDLRWAPDEFLAEPEAERPFFMSSSSSKRNGELKSFGDPDNPYTILKELGHGMTATVYRCRQGDRIFAVKAIGLSRLQMQRDKEKALERLRRESAILFAMRHPHVVSLYDVHETFERRFLVMECVDGGELIDEIGENGLPEHEARYVFLQIVLGLRYIHSKGVVHRDLKLENVLVDKKLSQPGLLQVKISDFGHSKLVNDGYSRTWSQVGTPNYWAPEVANASPGGYDERVDLWSLGVILFVLLEGVLPWLPFPSRSRSGVPKLIFQEDCKLSHLARHLSWSLMQIKPEDRLSLDGCLSHPWAMNSSGLLGQVVQLCEAHCRRQRGEWEWRAVLPHDPKNVRKLRNKLQELTLNHKYPMSLRARKEVAMCFREADDIDSVKAAWQELEAVLKPEFGRKLIEKHEVALDATAFACERSRQSLGYLEEKIQQQDAELEALAAAFPNNVEAATGSFAPTPRHLEVSLQNAQHNLWLWLELPQAYPSGRHQESPPELKHIMVHETLEPPWSKEAHDQLRSQIQGFLSDQVAGARPGDGSRMLLCWLQDNLLQSLSMQTEPSPAQQEPEKDLVNEASDSSVAPTPCTASRREDGEEFARVSVIVHHHNERMDEKGLASDRLRPSLRGKAFFPHLKTKFSKITGFLSFGKPALLLAEGPESDLHNLIAEVRKFPKWWDMAVRMFDQRKVADISACRAFTEFRKIKTEDIDTVLKGLSAEHCKLYEDVLLGTILDQSQRRREKARKSSKK